MKAAFTPEMINGLARIIHRDGWRIDTDIEMIEKIVMATVLLCGMDGDDPEEIFYLVKEELIALEDEGGYING